MAPSEHTHPDGSLHQGYGAECWKCGEHVCGVNLLGMGTCSYCGVLLPQDREDKRLRFTIESMKRLLYGPSDLDDPITRHDDVVGKLERAIAVLEEIEKGEWGGLNDSPSDLRRRPREMAFEALIDIGERRRGS